MSVSDFRSDDCLAYYAHIFIHHHNRITMQYIPITQRAAVRLAEFSVINTAQKTIGFLRKSGLLPCSSKNAIRLYHHASIRSITRCVLAQNTL